jgi:hypothetical protein
MWTKRNYLTCVSLILCLWQALPAHGEGVQPAADCPLSPVRNLTEQGLVGLLGIVPDARVVAIGEACGVDLTDDQLSSLRVQFVEQASVLDQLAQFRQPEPVEAVPPTPGFEVPVAKAPVTPVATAVRSGSRLGPMLLLVGSLGAATATGVMAISQEASMKSAVVTMGGIQSGPGAVALYNAARSDFTEAESARNLYRSVALGAAGVGIVAIVLRIMRGDGAPAAETSAGTQFAIQPGLRTVGVGIMRRW